MITALLRCRRRKLWITILLTAVFLLVELYRSDSIGRVDREHDTRDANIPGVHQMHQEVHHQQPDRTEEPVAVELPEEVPPPPPAPRAPVVEEAEPTQQPEEETVMTGLVKPPAKCNFPPLDLHVVTSVSPGDLSVRNAVRMIRSVLYFRSCRIHVHIITTALQHKTFAGLFRTWKIPEFTFSLYTLNKNNSKFNVSALVEILPSDLTKVIYVTSHIRFLTDIRSLYNIPTGDKAFAAIEEKKNLWGTNVVIMDMAMIREQQLHTGVSYPKNGFNSKSPISHISSKWYCELSWSCTIDGAIAWPSDQYSMNYDKVAPSVARTVRDVEDRHVYDYERALHPCVKVHKETSPVNPKDRCGQYRKVYFDNYVTHLYYINHLKHEKPLPIPDIGGGGVGGQDGGDKEEEGEEANNGAQDEKEEDKEQEEGKDDEGAEDGGRALPAYEDYASGVQNEDTSKAADSHADNIPVHSTSDDGEVTLVTMLSLERVENFMTFARWWTGPIHVVVYCTEAESRALEKMFLGSAILLKKEMAVHVVFQKGLFFPINYLRNVGIGQVTTQYTLFVDVDLIPNKIIYDVIKKEIKKLAKNTVLVVPSFEALEILPSIPENRNQLKVLINQKKAVGYKMYRKWNKGHSPTNYPKWMNAEESYYVPGGGAFEPYVVIPTKHAPKYREQLLERMGDKIAYTREVVKLGFKLKVLSDGFVIHIPHPKSSGVNTKLTERSFSRCANVLMKEHLQFVRSLTPIDFSDSPHNR